MSYSETMKHVDNDLGAVLPAQFLPFLEERKNFEIRDDDVVVCSFPKCGTTWTQEMVWCIGNDLNFDLARKLSIDERFPFFEACVGPVIPSLKESGQPVPAHVTADFIQNIKGRRFFMTHLPLEVLPRQLQAADRKAKIIYVTRDPRAACLSAYHFMKELNWFPGNLEQYLETFISDQTIYAPFWRRVLSFWNIRHQPNILFLNYEDMKRDLPSVLHRVAGFLDKTLSTDQVKALTEHLSFDNMKKNDAVNKEDLFQLYNSKGKMLREGKSEGYLKEFTPEQLEKFDSWNKKWLQGTDYPLPDYKK